jgi:hypothetical protein
VGSDLCIRDRNDGYRAMGAADHLATDPAHDYTLTLAASRAYRFVK